MVCPMSFEGVLWRGLRWLSIEAIRVNSALDNLWCSAIQYVILSLCGRRKNLRRVAYPLYVTLSEWNERRVSGAKRRVK
jgi:hypothetical protein